MKISDVRFDSEFEEDGTWWLPENQDNKFNGKLSYSPTNGIELKNFNGNNLVIALNDPTGGIEQNFNGVSKRYSSDNKTVYGKLKSGLEVSLFDLSAWLNNRSNFNIFRAFFGKHVEKKDLSQIHFQKVKIDFNFLDTLKDNNEIYDVYERNAQNKNLNNWKLKNAYEIEIDNIKAEISYSQNIEPKKHLESVEDIIITPETKVPFNWFSKVISDLENFLLLISDMHVQRTQILFYINDNDYISFLHKLNFPVDKKEMNYPRVKMIEVRHVKDKLGDILQSWFKISDELRPVFDFFFGVKINPSLYEESQYIHLMQALEIFLRKTDHFELLPKKAFQEFKNIMTKTIKDLKDLDFSKDFKESAKSKLQYWNEPSLRERLKRVISSLDEDLKNRLIHHIRGGDKEKIFINKVVNIRNDLIHHGAYKDDSKGKDIPHYDNISYYIKKLLVLLSYLILVEVGFPKDLVSKNLRSIGHGGYL